VTDRWAAEAFAGFPQVLNSLPCCLRSYASNSASRQQTRPDAGLAVRSTQ